MYTLPRVYPMAIDVAEANQKVLKSQLEVLERSTKGEQIRN